MNVYKMRAVLAELYTGESWKDRVSRMPNEQVLAVYKRFERHGELYKHNRRTRRDFDQEEELANNIHRSYLVKDCEGRLFYCQPKP